MTDRLQLLNIEVWTRIGMSEEERLHPQRLLVSVTLFHPLDRVAIHDDVTLGIDYADVLKCILLVSEGVRATVEHFAQNIAESLLAQFTPQGGVEVTVEKFPFPEVQSVLITLRRP